MTAPVVVKEVGFGMAPEDVEALCRAGVTGIDVAGAGGTNWARVEGLRAESASAQVAAAFADWGWPTVEAIRNGRAGIERSGRDDVVLIASGGLRDGVDALKALCLGADLAALARGLLAAAARGPEDAAAAVAAVVRQLEIAAWAAGASSAGDLTTALLTTA